MSGGIQFAARGPLVGRPLARRQRDGATSNCFMILLEDRIMFARRNTKDRSASRRRRNWSIGAWVIGILLLGMTAPLKANDQNARPRNGSRQVESRGHSHGSHEYRSGTQRQFDRGYRAGSRNGREAGYYDGMHGHGYHPQPNYGSRGHSRYFAKGYRRGYHEAYEEAFHQAEHERQHQRRHERRRSGRRWSWSIRW